MTQQELKNELEEELKADALLEAKQEAYHDKKAREDLSFALELCGLDDIHSQLCNLTIELEDYGHQVSVKELTELLEEY